LIKYIKADSRYNSFETYRLEEKLFASNGDRTPVVVCSQDTLLTELPLLLTEIRRKENPPDTGRTQPSVQQTRHT
jgi:hypothetical protein